MWLLSSLTTTPVSPRASCFSIARAPQQQTQCPAKLTSGAIRRMDECFVHLFRASALGTATKDRKECRTRSLPSPASHSADTKREKVARTGLGRPGVAAGSSRHVRGGGCSYAVPLPCRRKTARRSKTAKGWHSSSTSYGAGRHSSQWWPCSATLSHVRRPARPCDRAHSTQSVKWDLVISPDQKYFWSPASDQQEKA